MKKGAFVNGVNVLDSNPKAYKLVKKKYKMLNKGGLIKKAKEGTALNSLINFFNSDLGNGLTNFTINGLGLIFNNIKTTSAINEANEAIDKNTEAQKNRLLANAYNWAKLAVYSALNQNNQLEDTTINNNSEIVLNNLAYNIANQISSSDYLNILQLAAKEKIKKLLEILAIQGSGLGFGDILQSGLGMIGNFLNKKSSNQQNASVNYQQKTPNYYELFYGNSELPKVDLMLTYKDMLKPKYNTINLDNNSSMNKLKIDLYSKMI